MVKKSPDGVIGFADEIWWSRLAFPALHAWAEGKQQVRLIEQSLPKDDPDSKALACYGLLLSCPADTASLPEQVWLRFVSGRPVSAITTQFLDWAATKLASLGKRFWLLIWDNASWHLSKQVRSWIRAHNQQVKAAGRGLRILTCFLPTKSPWLNPIEPRWLHARRRILEPDRLLSAAELEQRICDLFACQREPRLSVPENVS